MLCQACKERPIEIIKDSDIIEQPYELCSECHKRLLSYSLKPYEWYNLAVIHTSNKYFLNDDFYEDNGVAMGPDQDFVAKPEESAPQLSQVKLDLESLIDFCITKWYLSQEMIDELKKHNQQLLLNSIINRFNKSNYYFFKSRLYEIAGKVLGSVCEKWVREKWAEYNEEYLSELSLVASNCLPFDEGYNLVINALENISKNEFISLLEQF